MSKLIEMLKRSLPETVLFVILAPALGFGQTNPLWTPEEAHMYLPHLTWPEVEEFLQRSDMVILPVGSGEQHGLHLPLGTAYLDGMVRAKR